jgi:hypothetical protein
LKAQQSRLKINNYVLKVFRGGLSFPHVSLGALHKILP